MTEPYYIDPTVTIHAGDCLDVLAKLPDASVDAVVTDPPYGLSFMGKEWDRPTPRGASAACAECGNDDPAEGFTVCSDCLPVVGDAAIVKTSDHGGRSMLGHVSANWSEKGTHSRGYADNDNRAFQQWCQQWATECLRVLKPGGHLLAFGGTRTSHRLACAIEDAGFEIRDSIAWLYGSGFPKSLDVSKAIDKRRDDTADVRVVCRWLRQIIDEHHTLTVRGLAEHFGFHPRMVEHWAARDTDSQPTLPTLDQWDALREALGFGDQMDAEVLRLNLRKGEPGEAWADRPVTGQVAEWTDRVNYALTSRDGLRRDIPATPDAERWQGWGTALKPAHEPIVVARKPLVGTVAATVLAHGTGALNVDGCRVAGDVPSVPQPSGVGGVYDASDAGRSGVMSNPHTAGRWPANVVLDESQAEALDEQSGESRSASGPVTYSQQRSRRGASATVDTGNDKGRREVQAEGFGDLGGASRFFYTAKAASTERVRVPKVGAGESRVTGLGGKKRRCRVCGSQAPQLDQRCGHDDYEWVEAPNRGDMVAHPTVKPLALMRWLVRLVTPPGGTVLEPFAGSGTTVEACILEGFRCIAIEREADYLPLIRQRIHRRRDPVEAVRATGEDAGLFDLLGGDA